MNIEIFDPSVIPAVAEIPEHSVDVITIDEEGMYNLAFYSFGDKRWIFHTDTLVDYNEPGHEMKWKWFYPQFGLKEAFGELSKIEK